MGPESLLKKDIYDKFVRSFVEKAKELKVGDPKIKHNDLGAIVSEAHLKNIIEHVDNALKKGAKIGLWKKTKTNRRTIWWVLHVSNSFIKHQKI